MATATAAATPTTAQIQSPPSQSQTQPQPPTTQQLSSPPNTTASTVAATTPSISPPVSSTSSLPPTQQQQQHPGGVTPNQTLYINNINDKIKQDEIKKGLYHIFSPYGNIIDIILSKRWILRGQAFIIFDRVQTATQALHALQNFLFFSKPLHITYAKSKSDVVSKADNTYTQRPKRKKTR